MKALLYVGLALFIGLVGAAGASSGWMGFVAACVICFIAGIGFWSLIGRLERSNVSAN